MEVVSESSGSELNGVNTMLVEVVEVEIAKVKLTL